MSESPGGTTPGTMKDPLEDYVMDLDATTIDLDLKAFDKKYRGYLPKTATEYYSAAYQ